MPKLPPMRRWLVLFALTSLFVPACAGLAVIAGVSIDQGDAARLAIGQSLQLSASVVATGDAPDSVVWSSSNEAVATVDAQGLVVATATEPSLVVITATSAADASKSDGITITIVPANDAFADAIALVAASGSTALATTYASTEPDEPAPSGNPGGASVWWTLTPSAPITLQVTTASSDYDTILALYEGATLATLTEIAFDDDGGPGTTSLIVANLRAGVTYAVRADGFDGATGRLVLGHSTTVRPDNDDFADAIALETDSGTTTLSTLNATLESGEPVPSGATGGASVWWTVTPATSGSLDVDLGLSNYDTILVVYQGADLSSLNEIAFDDDGGLGTTSRLVVDLQVGVAYAIRADGYDGATGDLWFDWTFTPAP